MFNKKIYNTDYCQACYFRSVAVYPYKKVLLQLTEKCNLNCAHCFVSSTNKGDDMGFKEIKENVLPFLLSNSVKKVTLTGGEPLLHKNILDIVGLLVNSSIAVSICTNASLITEEFVEKLSYTDLVHFNVSLDGYSYKSHGQFRGISSAQAFDRIIFNIRLLGKCNKLNGILVTPNIYATVDEYVDICKFAVEVGAKYVLMNPLSQFGRGQETTNLAFSKEEMLKLRAATEKFNSDNFEVVYIRFPNEGKPLSSCVAGNIVYIFTNGCVAICPYMVFAAKDEVSKYKPKDFIIGNVFDYNFSIDGKLQSYVLPKDCLESYCDNCDFATCGKGCYAAKISRGLFLSECDNDLCPNTNNI